MSKVPERHGKLPRPAEMRNVYSKTKVTKSLTEDVNVADHNTFSKPKHEESFIALIPKMSKNLENAVEQNPRILDLREKLNKITKKQNRSVDKETKGLINDITQQLVDEKDDGSGPYSLLFDLQSDPSTSFHKKVKSDNWKQGENNSVSSKSAERLPNVLNFDDKPMKEFEYSCESETESPVKKNFNTHSRSDLCLQLKSHRPFDSNLSPNENSCTRANEENSLDDSLGILTPDQMDDMCYLDNTFSPTVEGLPIFCQSNETKISPDNGDSPSTEKTESDSAPSTIQNEGFDLAISKDQNIKIPHSEAHVKNVEKLCLAETEIIVDPPVLNENVTGIGEITLVSEVELAPSLEDEFLPSIHSSILEPVSSMADPTVNLDAPLEIQLNKDTRIIVNRIEQTPSPEDLPLDNSEINGEISSYSQLSASTLHDSQTYSDSKIDYPKSMETSKVSNSFITSITSITSLDGYQGDGEMSRPVSRGADHSISHREDVIEMDWQNVPVTRRADPMTDSDFFTESDADGLDENVQRGDRRAQVIDGALYGGKNANGNPPLIVNRNEDSCMESSGVYTDFENHSSPVFLNAIDDMSPAGSTPSTRSECSQKNGSMGKLETYFDNLDKKEKIPEVPNEVEEEKVKNTSKRNSLNTEKDARTVEKSKEEKRFTLKKYKMPKRDVPSKLKSMLVTRKIDADSSAQSSPKTVKKIERREGFTKKNSLDLKSEYKAKSFKDVKSKVDCSLSLQRSQTTCNVNRMLSSKSTNTNIKPKTRHMRMRMELGSAAGSGKSSLHSSQSDLSATSTPPGKHPGTRFPLIRNGKKREVPPPPATRVPASPQQPSQVPVKKNGVVQKLSASPVSVRSRTSLAPPSSPRKPAPHRTPAQRPNTLPTNKETARVAAAVGPRGKRAPTPQQPRALPATATQPLVPRDQTAALAHAAKGVEALGVLVQYLVFRLDALNGDSWRLEAERWRGVAAAERTTAARADRDRQQRAQKDLDTIAECLSKISELEMEVSTKEEATARLQATHMEEVTALSNDIKELKGTIESLKHEVAESRARLHAHSEIERTLRAQLEAARSELDARQEHSNKNGDLYCTNGEVSHNTNGDMSDDIERDTCSMEGDEDIPYSPKGDGSYNIRRGSYTIERDDSYVMKGDVSYSDAACDPVRCEAEIELRLAADEELSTDANELAAEVRSLRAVIELKQAEMASLRDARSELAIEREKRVAAERDARAARHAAEELKERAAARQREADRLKEDNRRLRDVAARDRDHASRVSALNEELRYKLRQKSQVVSLLASGGYMDRSLRARTSSGDSARSTSPPPDSPPSPASSPAPADTPPLPAVKGVVEKHDSVSWVLEIEETPEEVATRLARKSSFRSAPSPGGVKRRGGGSPGSSPAPASPAPNASKLFRPGDLDFPPPPPPLKESAGEAIYIYDDHRY